MGNPKVTAGRNVCLIQKPIPIFPLFSNSRPKISVNVIFGMTEKVFPKSLKRTYLKALGPAVKRSDRL